MDERAVGLLRSVLGDEPAWFVGGGLRDELLGRPTDDIDVVLSGNTGSSAKALAAAANAHWFQLSDQFAGWRVLARDGSWQIDLNPLRGETIEDDLALRDFTINAMARAVSSDDHLIDPFGGADDVAARLLRVISERSLPDDPLRAVRLARLACELEFEIEEATLTAAQMIAPTVAEVAQERIFGELKRIITSPRVLPGLALLDDLGLTTALLPELSDQDLSVALDSLLEVERDPAGVFGDRAAEVSERLQQPLADELTHWQALRLGTLLHGLAAKSVRQITGRLRTSDRLSSYLATLVQHHRELAELVDRSPSRRDIFRYLSSCDPFELDVMALSAVISKTRGVEAALIDEILAWPQRERKPLIRGDELAHELGIERGPELGKLLSELEEARFAGEISSPEQAIEYAFRLAARHG